MGGGYSGIESLDRFTGGASEVVGVMDLEFVIRYVNWTAPGLTRKSVVGQSAFSLIPERDTAAARAAFDTVFQTATPATFEITYDTPEGVIVFVVRVSPIFHEGKVIGAFTLNIDATEDRRETIDRDRFFSLSLDMLVVVNAKGILRRLNPAFGEALGYCVSDIIGKPFTTFVHPDDVERTRLAYESVLTGVAIKGFESRYRRRDGSYRVFSWRATVDPVTKDVYAVARDITEQRTTEAQLRHAQKMEAVGQLAGGIAHDFNNLMQAVLANVEAAMIPGSTRQELLEHLQEIEGAGQRAAELTKQLLVFSRRQTLHRIPLDLNALVAGLMKMLSRLLPENIHIEFRPGEGVPTVHADATQLEQVVINLCVNARDAMEGGGTLLLKTGDIVFGEEDRDLQPETRPGYFAFLTVIDSGIGMTQEILDRMFDPFFTTKSHRSGTGLGLSTLYGIVQQHGGMVRAGSEPGRGSTFSVFLPVDGRPAQTVMAAEHPKKSMIGSETLLVVEDEDVVRKPLVHILESAGYRTLAATNGREAIATLTENPDGIDLVILDLVMPEMSGPETWQRMCKVKPGLGVVFMSGYADVQYRNRLPPDTEILDKPFPSQELLRRIRARLDR